MPMYSAFVPRGMTFERIIIENDGDIPEYAVWLDLVRPQKDRPVQRTLGISKPTRDRLYFENGAHYMTATLMCHSDTETPLTTPVTFILSDHRLTTVRYEEPKPFIIVGAKLAHQSPATVSGETVMMDLLDVVIAHAREILVKIRSEIDAASHDILEPEDKTDHTRSVKEIFKTIGRKGEQTSKLRESLVSIGHLLRYLAANADTVKWAKDRSALKGMQRDVQSLSGRATYLLGEVNFLFDATRWGASLEHNKQLMASKTATLLFMPPNLIASIYGMNFKHMPELYFEFAYPLAFMLMLFAAIVPYYFFKSMKWV
jgi:magnesium transporter